MKAVVQRVLRASVEVDGVKVSSIGKGLCVLVGISKDDVQKDAEYILKKLLKMRLFDSDQLESGNTNGPTAAGGVTRPTAWKSSVMDIEAEILCVSQFTLYGSLSKGNKPDFHAAMNSLNSKVFYEDFVKRLQTEYKEEKIKDGIFGAMMKVEIINDGPVTILLDSKRD